MKAPRTNIQIPEKLQESNFEDGRFFANFGVSDLEFLWSLELGAWSLFQK